jgi:hypothetical protein
MHENDRCSLAFLDIGEIDAVGMELLDWWGFSRRRNAQRETRDDGNAK